MNVASFVDWSLLQSRYKHIGTAVEKMDPDNPIQRYCYVEELQDLVLGWGGVKEHLQSSLKQLVNAFNKIKDVAGPARRDMFLADFFELSISQIVGPNNVKQFLYDLCYC